MNGSDMAHRLLSSIDPSEAAAHSTLNHHAIGLDYLNLLRTDRFTIKLYIAEAGRLVGCGNGKYVVNPHTHNYAFETEVLAGTVTNVLFYEQTSGRPNYERQKYNAATRAHGKRTPVRLGLRSGIAYSREGRYYLDPIDIHTIEIDTGRTAVFLLQQFNDVGTETNLYVRPDDTPRFDGLYARATSDDVRRLMQIAWQHV